jgi:YD repeat-containing protein
MKKLYLFLIITTLSISCEKPAEEVTKVETVCQIQKISYDDGYYELYKFDGNQRLIETTFNFDDDGKLVDLVYKHEYNTSGNLIKSTDNFGWTLNWVYAANEALTRMDLKDEKGELYDQFDFTLDAQKRITKLVTKSEGVIATYVYNGPNGAFSKSEVTLDGKLLDRSVVNTYYQDNSKKSFRMVFKGHPFEPAQFAYDMIYSDPLYLTADNMLPVTGTSSTQYNEDWTELTDKTRVYYDFKATRKFNSNNFVSERASADAIENKTYIKTYSYSNCN